MQIKVYRSLDRSLAFFGIKGRYQKIALCAYVLDLMISMLVSRITVGLFGLLAFLAIGGLIYLGIISLQGLRSDRNLHRMLYACRLPSYVKVQPCRVSTILAKTQDHGKEAAR